MKLRPDYAGKLTLRWKEYVVNCALCSDYEVAHERTYVDAENFTRSCGWSRTNNYGWLCPECQRKVIDENPCI